MAVRVQRTAVEAEVKADDNELFFKKLDYDQKHEPQQARGRGTTTSGAEAGAAQVRACEGLATLAWVFGRTYRELGSRVNGGVERLRQLARLVA